MTFTTFAAEYALRLIALVAVVGIGLAQMQAFRREVEEDL